MGIGHTAKSDIIVVVQFVDSLNYTTNVELLNGIVQVHDSRVFRVTTEDKLSLSSPKSGENPTSASPTRLSTSLFGFLCESPKFRDINATTVVKACELQGYENEIGVER